LVEFGVSIAAVAFVALLGFHALGAAQSAYWGGTVQAALAQPTPVAGDFIHPTQVSGNCTPTALIAEQPNTLTCNIAVADTWHNNLTAPRGQVSIQIDALPPLATCAALTPNGGGQPYSTCSFSPSWTPSQSDAGVPHTLVASYLPDSTDGGRHAPSALNPPEAITVSITIAFTPDSSHATPCWNPYSIPGFTQADQVEVGHPVICHVLVSYGPGHPVSNTAVQVYESSVTGVPGTPYFSCFTHNNVSQLATCNNAGPTFIGNTGDVSSGHPGELWFVYRRYYDALVSAAQVTFTAATMGFTNNASATHQISVEPPIAGTHTSDLVVDCPTNVTSTTSWLAANGQTVKSDTQLTGLAGSPVTCTVVVFDSSQPFYAGGNPDEEDLYSPAGTVAWFDANNNPVNDIVTGKNTCTLSSALGNALPAFKQVQLHGLPSESSGCSMTFSFSGTHTLIPSYVPEPAPRMGHTPKTGLQIATNFP
jgi:hypothetical protein